MMFPPTHNRQMQVHRPPRNTKHGAQPHKGKYSTAQLRANIQFLLARDHALEHNVHGCCRRASRKIQESGNKGEGDEVVGVPARPQDERRQEDQEEGDNDTQEEEPEHHVRHDVD